MSRPRLQTLRSAATSLCTSSCSSRTAAGPGRSNRGQGLLLGLALMLDVLQEFMGLVVVAGRLCSQEMSAELVMALLKAPMLTQPPSFCAWLAEVECRGAGGAAQLSGAAVAACAAELPLLLPLLLLLEHEGLLLSLLVPLVTGPWADDSCSGPGGVVECTQEVHQACWCCWCCAPGTWFFICSGAERPTPDAAQSSFWLPLAATTLSILLLSLLLTFVERLPLLLCSTADVRLGRNHSVSPSNRLFMMLY